MNNSTLLAGIMSFIAGGMTMKAIQVIKDRKEDEESLEEEIDDEY